MRLNIVNSYYSWRGEHFYEVPHITSLMWFNVGTKNVAKELKMICCGAGLASFQTRVLTIMYCAVILKSICTGA